MNSYRTGIHQSKERKYTAEKRVEKETPRGHDKRRYIVRVNLSIYYRDPLFTGFNRTFLTNIVIKLTRVQLMKNQRSVSIQFIILKTARRKARVNYFEENRATIFIDFIQRTE